MYGGLAVAAADTGAYACRVCLANTGSDRRADPDALAHLDAEPVARADRRIHEGANINAHADCCHLAGGDNRALGG